MTRRLLAAHFSKACILTLIASPLKAADWRTSAAVTPGVTYTDNVCLSESNEKGEWIGFVTPELDLRADGRRVDLVLNGEIEINSLSDSKLESLGCVTRGLGNRNQFAPRLFGTSEAILIRDWLYLDAYAEMRQNAANPYQSGGDALDRTGNTNTTSSYGVSPYLSRRIKNVAELKLRYRWDEQFNSQDTIADSTSQNFQFELSSNPDISNFFLGLQADDDTVEYSGARGVDGQTSELKSAQINAGYRFNRLWQINGYYGEEDNDFISVRDQIDGTFWDVGFKWTPNTRTTVEGGTGERFFGNTPRFSIRHRYRRSEFVGSYDKQITYDRNIRLLNDPLASANQSDEQVNEPLTPESNEYVPATTASTSPQLDERLSLAYSYSWRRYKVGFGATRSDQTRTEDSDQSTFESVALTLSGNLSRKTAVLGSVRRVEQSPKGEQSEITFQSETWQALTQVDYFLDSSTTLSLLYNFVKRDSERDRDNYTENQITLSLTMAF
jgi:uncharacterized protein (PEP-CTERM system associated)